MDKYITPADMLSWFQDNQSVFILFPNALSLAEKQQLQSSKWKFEFTGPNQILELIYIYSWLSLSRIGWDDGKKFESTVVRLKRSYENTGSVVCLTTKGRQPEWNFEELKPASHVPIFGTILNIFDVFVAVFFSLLNSLNLVERLVTSRYLFLCVWICLSVLFMFFSCCIVIKLHPSWHIFLCVILFIYNKLCVFIIQ